MKRCLSSAASAVALSAALVLGGPAFAADPQLQNQVKGQLQQHGIEIKDVGELTDTQLLQIALLLSTSESQSSQHAAVDSLLAIKEPCIANAQMRQSVAGQLSQHGIKVKNLDSVSGTQLAVVQAVLSSNQPPTEMAAQIEQIFASDSPIVGNDQLRAEVKSCVVKLNVDLDNLDALTPEQMVQIQLIAGGSDSESEKRAAIEKLANE